MLHKTERFRFAASTHSLMAVCPAKWLHGPKGRCEGKPRWELTGILRAAPDEPLILPVRDIKAVYALKKRLYDSLRATHIPQPHEFFLPVGALLEERSHENPAMQELFARACGSSNFLPA